MQPITDLHFLQLAEKIVESTERFRLLGVRRNTAILVEPNIAGKVEDLPA